MEVGTVDRETQIKYGALAIQELQAAIECFEQMRRFDLVQQTLAMKQDMQKRLRNLTRH